MGLGGQFFLQLLGGAASRYSERKQEQRERELKRQDAEIQRKRDMEDFEKKFAIQQKGEKDLFSFKQKYELKKEKERLEKKYKDDIGILNSLGYSKDIISNIMSGGDSLIEDAINVGKETSNNGGDVGSIYTIKQRAESFSPGPVINELKRNDEYFKKINVEDEPEFKTFESYNLHFVKKYNNALQITDVNKRKAAVEKILNEKTVADEVFLDQLEKERLTVLKLEEKFKQKTGLTAEQKEKQELDIRKKILDIESKQAYQANATINFTIASVLDMPYTQNFEEGLKRVMYGDEASTTLKVYNALNNLSATFNDKDSRFNNEISLTELDGAWKTFYTRIETNTQNQNVANEIAFSIENDRLQDDKVRLEAMKAYEIEMPDDLLFDERVPYIKQQISKKMKSIIEVLGASGTSKPTDTENYLFYIESMPDEYETFFVPIYGGDVIPLGDFINRRRPFYK